MSQILIIAEAGVNHNGDLDRALELVEKAQWAGADYVKFQTFKTSKLVTKNAEQANYQTENTGIKKGQYDLLKELELSFEQFDSIIEHCKKVGIKFLSTPFDDESAEYLKGKQDFFKVGSGDLTNGPLLKQLALMRVPLVLSTGMATIDEILRAKGLIKTIWNKHGEPKGVVPGLSFLHCSTSYPLSFDEVNLNAMRQMEKELGVPVGYSDHTLGIEVPIAAVACGATIIEKHFTLSKKLPGPDHKASLEPDQLKQMVQAIRNIEFALGDGKKRPMGKEIENLKVARKSLFYATDLDSGHVLKEQDFCAKRPVEGVSPFDFEKLVGRKLKKAVSTDTPVSWDDVL